MPCHEMETAVLLRDMRELRGMVFHMQVVYQETRPQGWAREAPPGQTLRWRHALSRSRSRLSLKMREERGRMGQNEKWNGDV